MLGVIKKKQNNSLYVVTSRCTAALHRTGFYVYAQLCPSHDKNHQKLPKSVSPSSSGIKKDDTEHLVSGS